MKNLMLFLRALLTDVGNNCGIDTSLDYEYIEARVKQEGLSFLTISLSTFGSDFERSLETGVINSTSFTGFKRKGRIPQFLSGFMEILFDVETGWLLDGRGTRVTVKGVSGETAEELDQIRDAFLAQRNWELARAIKSIRQIVHAFSKIRLDCSQERVDAAFKKYIECENEIRSADARLLDDTANAMKFERLARILYGDLFSEIDRQIVFQELVPKHGPGATADRLVGNKKYGQTAWPTRLEAVFPYQEFVRPGHVSPDSLVESELVPDFVEPGSEIPVRVISVPKTQKTTRIIAIEPTCMQYTQQSLKEVISDFVAKDILLRDFIGFDDQTPNQRLAQKGSFDGSLATLDLSEASDRVSCLHVALLMLNHPASAEAVAACRSTKADVPGYGVITLAKFASMGSALTFPFEALVFLTLVFRGIEEALNIQLSREDLMGYHGSVRVYGDDIIVPAEFATSVVSSLESFGYKVNQSKSFWNSMFRESCGKEYYAGVDVTISRVRSMLPTTTDQTEEIVSTVSLRNQLFKRGYFKSVEFLDGVIERLIPFPIVEETSPILGKLSDQPFYVDKFSERYQIPLVRGMVIVPRLRPNKIDGEGALMKFFLKRGDEPFFDKDHLLFGGRPVSVELQTRLASPY